LTDGLLAKEFRQRDALVQEWLRVGTSCKPADYSSIHYEHGRVFYKKTLGGENVGKLYCPSGGHGTEKLLFDPATYQSRCDHDHSKYCPVNGREHVAMGLSSGGANMVGDPGIGRGTGEPCYADSIYPSYGPHGWAKDSKSFFYDAGKVTDIKSLEIELNRKTKVHRLGIDTSHGCRYLQRREQPGVGADRQGDPRCESVIESYPGYIVDPRKQCNNEIAGFSTLLSPNSSTQ